VAVGVVAVCAMGPKLGEQAGRIDIIKERIPRELTGVRHDVDKLDKNLAELEGALGVLKIQIDTLHDCISRTLKCSESWSQPGDGQCPSSISQLL